MDIKTAQLTLEFEPGMTDRYKSLRECLVACVYSKGLSNVAFDLGKSPGNLSHELSEETTRHFSVESLEMYIQKSGDLMPIYYLIARYLGNQAAAEGATLRRVEDQLQEMVSMVAQLAASNKPMSRKGR